VTLAPPLEDLEILVFGDPDEAHLCESNHCKIVGRGVHEAHLWARLPCGYVYKICRAREYEYSQQKEIHCSEHCGKIVDPNEVRTWPIGR
jgi:hypothetical protein